MTNHAELLRIRASDSFFDIVKSLSEGVPGSMKVVMESFDKSPLFLLSLDSKHLYGKQIWELYKNVCGEDMERFSYHVDMELPCQVCGKLDISGPYAARMSEAELTEHFEARKFGKPGYFWALENPPEKSNYDYPIKLKVKTTNDLNP